MTAGVAAPHHERLPVPLRRHCQNCTDGQHGQRCEKTVYCSPWWPCVPCECECHDPIPLRPLITRDNMRHPRFVPFLPAKADRGRRGAAATLERHGRAHYIAAGYKGALATNAKRRAMRRDLATAAIRRFVMDAKGED